MRRLVLLFIAAVFLGSALPLQAAELVMYRRAGCPYCEAFDREIGPAYPKTELGRKLPLRHVHIDKGRDRSVELKTPVRFTPTFVLVEDGKEKGRIEGYPGDLFFWSRLENLCCSAP